MQASIFPMIRSHLHFLTRKFAGEVIVSTLSSLLVMVALHHNKPPELALNTVVPLHSGFARSPTDIKDTEQDFIIQTALSHVSHPVTKSIVIDQTNLVPNDVLEKRSISIIDAPPSVKHVQDTTQPTRMHFTRQARPPIPEPRPHFGWDETKATAQLAPTVALPTPPTQIAPPAAAKPLGVFAWTKNRVVESVGSMGNAITSTFAGL